jgi:hypothetical protein
LGMKINRNKRVTILFIWLVLVRLKLMKKT